MAGHTRGRPSGESRGTRALRVLEDANIALTVADHALTEALREVRTYRVELIREFPEHRGAAA